MFCVIFPHNCTKYKGVCQDIHIIVKHIELHVAIKPCESQIHDSTEYLYME